MSCTNVVAPITSSVPRGCRKTVTVVFCEVHRGTTSGTRITRNTIRVGTLNSSVGKGCEQIVFPPLRAQLKTPCQTPRILQPDSVKLLNLRVRCHRLSTHWKTTAHCRTLQRKRWRDQGSRLRQRVLASAVEELESDETRLFGTQRWRESDLITSVCLSALLSNEVIIRAIWGQF